MLGHGLKIHGSHGALFAGRIPSRDPDRPCRKAQAPVRDHPGRIHLHQRAQAAAGGTGAIGIVEGKHARGEFLNADVAVRAGVVLRKHHILAVNDIDHHQAAGQRGRCFQRVGEPLLHIRPDHQPVHHHFDGVLIGLLKFRRIAELIDLAIHPNPYKALLGHILHQLGMLTLTTAHNGRKQLNPGALGQGHDLIHDLVHGLLADFLSANRAMRGTGPGIQKPQIIVNLGHRAHRGARIPAGGLLVDGNGRRKALDVVHVRLFHLAQKLTRIGGKRLHIAPLTLGIDGIKGQR